MNNMPDMPVQVPVDDPNADTEWNDILRSKGIIPEREPSPTPQIEAAILQARELAYENRLEGKDLDELDELEDDEDEAFLDSYRQKRMAELNTLQTKSIFNQVYPVQKSEWNTAVTEASKEAWVFVLLTSSSGTNKESQIMIQIWRDLAKKFGDIKFCQIRGDLCIEGYPDRNTPTVLVYRDTEIKRQIVTLKEINGEKTDTGDLEKILLGLGAIKYGDSRLKRRDENEREEERPYRSIRQGERKGGEDHDDSDWD